MKMIYNNVLDLLGKKCDLKTCGNDYSLKKTDIGIEADLLKLRLR